jgi:Concanavalin A-like lectin/glucanases superfamily
MGTSAGPDIVEDGLVLHLDAGSKRSYPGTGTTWTDLTANNNGTLINGPAFNSANLGSISLDGTDDYINLGSFFTYQNFTISIWVNAGSSQTTQYSIIFDNNHTGTRNFVLQGEGNFGASYGFGVRLANNTSIGIGPIILTPNVWTNLTFTFSSTGSLIGYINGVVLSSVSTGNQPPLYSSPLLYIGQWATGIENRSWNGKVSNFSVYNRPLTENEVKQNYNALRGRYSI